MRTRSAHWLPLGAQSAVEEFASNRYSFESLSVTYARSVDGLVRLRIERAGYAFPPYSYAIAKEPEWLPTDAAPAIEYNTVDSVFRICGLDGKVTEISVQWNRTGFRFEIALEAQHHVYGLGERTGQLDKRGRTYAMWNTDEPNHYPQTDPLYQSIPWAIVFEPTKTVGLFLDCTAVSYFDVGETESDRLIIEGYDQAMDLYLFVEPNLPAIVRRFTALCGLMNLPPLWALGFQQCRYSYYPAARVREVAAKLRAEHIPCDVLYLDIHYMDGYRVFTWDPERFPQPAELTAALARQGFRVVTIVDPGVKVDGEYAVYRDGLQQDVFLRHPDGRLYVGKVWPGPAAFPDFSHPRVRQWWADAHSALLGVGVAGIWNDMNEPADFSGEKYNRVTCTAPDELLVNHEGLGDRYGSTLARLHNCYATGMNMATHQALAAQRPAERPFVLTRAGYAGIQRHAAVWMGDNHSWWEHLSAALPMLLNEGLSGVAFCGCDAGGFQQNASGELYARWMAVAALTPFFRAHSDLGTADHEPWSFGPAVLAAVREAIETRYRLLPYLYTLFEQASQTGEPIMQPLVYRYPQDEKTHLLQDQYLLGADLLVAPILTPGVDWRAVYLPAGGWFDLWDGTFYPGGGAVLAQAPLGRVPLFVRAGAAIPSESVRQHTGRQGDGNLTVIVAPDGQGQASGALYSDAGQGFDYREGAYTRLRFALSGDNLRVWADHREAELPWTTKSIVDLRRGGWNASGAVRAPLVVEAVTPQSTK